PLKRVRPDLPTDLCDVVGRLLASRPDDRFATADDAADALDDVVSLGYPARRPRGAKGRAPGASARRAAEPDLPPLNSSVIEAAFLPRDALVSSPAPSHSRGPAEAVARVPLLDDLDHHRKTLEADGGQSG